MRQKAAAGFEAAKIIQVSISRDGCELKNLLNVV
jgi:hypothetical protein